jgi:hypothetical protein
MSRVKRCEGALEKLNGTFEQCDNVAEGGSDFCWECQQIGNKKYNEENT